MHQFSAKERSALFSVPIFVKIVKIAVPSILQQSFISVGNIIIQSVINSFGAGVIAGYSAAIKLNNLVITSFTTLGNGVSNYTAQNLGAGKNERISAGFAAGRKLVWMLCVPLVLLYFCAGQILLHLFMDEPSQTALQTGMEILRILSPFYFVAALKLVADGILRGAGMMKQFMASTFTDLILRVVLAIVFSKFLGSLGIWCAWPVGWTVSTAMSVSFYHTGPWNKRTGSNA
jgi:Na+-driven multidrug efflux pump